MIRVEGVEKGVSYCVVCENMTEDAQVGPRAPDALCVSSCSKGVGSKELIVSPAQQRVRSGHRGLSHVRWETDLCETSCGRRSLCPFSLHDCKAHMGGLIENWGSNTECETKHFQSIFVSVTWAWCV